jgi:holo-[acyl-carrier protein] synthase
MNFIKGVGIDIAKIPRFSRLLEQKYINNFLNKALHPIEIEEINKLKQEQKAKYLASRWSYKEALVKATGDKGIIFSKCFLKKNESGKPFIHFDEDYKDSNMNIKHMSKSLHVSISHEEDTSVAIVIIENEK